MSLLIDSDQIRTVGAYGIIPKSLFQNSQYEQHRKKRSALAVRPATKEKNLSGIVESLGKPLEVVPLDAKNMTEENDKAETRMISEQDENQDEGKEVEINDFIRFRRSAANENLQKLAGDPESDVLKMKTRSEKLMLDKPNEHINREARGATKEHWVKQIYPVRKGDEMSFDDNFPSSSESVRAPRVHFVTQKFGDNGLASIDPRPFEREPRSRHLDREPPRELSRDLARDIGRENTYYERSFRSYALPADRPILRNEFYPRYENRGYRDVYRPRYENYDRVTRSDYTVSPQKRIIYYATLPEISRSPPNVDLKERYRYDRDRYDDRYLSDPYRPQKMYPKSGYGDEGKTPYPVKVLTDVNVREVKKNPERRIYSEVDKNRYAYNTLPYHLAEG